MIASKRSDLKKTDWEIDFYSRPIIDENGKKRWELLITSTNNFKDTKTFKWEKICPAPSVNSIWLKDALDEAIDEAYYEFLDEPLDLLPLVKSGEMPNLLLMRTFSKIYGLAGLRIGYGIGHPDFISAMEKVRQPFNINSIAQSGALAALDDEEHLNATRKINTEGLKFFESVCSDLGVEFVPSYANFILIKVGDGVRVFEYLQKCGVISRPMAGYGLPEWIRLSIGTSNENIRSASVLKSALI